MKLITELNENVEYISEAAESGEKTHYIQGVMLQSGIPNRNGRMYPEKIMEAEVARYVKNLVEDRRAYGELGHPAGPQINLDRVSHIITELKKDGKNFVGKARLTETPMGGIAIGLLKSGAKLGVSSRGMGSLIEKNGLMEVQDDFRLNTAADIVADPSAPNAFVNGIMENVDWVYDSATGEWQQTFLHETRKRLSRETIRQIEEQRLQIFEDYLASLTARKL